MSLRHNRIALFRVLRAENQSSRPRTCSTFPRTYSSGVYVCTTTMATSKSHHDNALARLTQPPRFTTLLDVTTPSYVPPSPPSVAPPHRPPPPPPTPSTPRWQTSSSPLTSPPSSKKTAQQGSQARALEIPAMEEWNPDKEHHDTYKLNGLDLPATVRHSRFADLRDITGMDLLQVPLWKLLYQGLHNS